MSNSTSLDYWRSPSVEITYAASAILLFQLPFLGFQIYNQLLEGKKTKWLKMNVFSEFAYGIIFFVAIILSYVQTNRDEITRTVYPFFALVAFTDLLFTLSKTATFTSNRIMFNEKYHKALLALNATLTILSPFVLIPTFIAYNYVDERAIELIAVIVYFLYLVDQVINMVVFFYITQKALDKSSVRKLRFYTLNLLLSGIVCKGYVTAIIAIRGDRLYPWSIIIFDGNLLCIYFINITWPKIAARFHFRVNSLSELSESSKHELNRDRDSAESLKGKPENAISESV